MKKETFQLAKQIIKLIDDFTELKELKLTVIGKDDVPKQLVGFFKEFSSQVLESFKEKCEEYIKALNVILEYLDDSNIESVQYSMNNITNDLLCLKDKYNPPKKETEKEEQTCPHLHLFGVNTDETDDCDECELWQACNTRNNELNKTPRRKKSN